MDKTEAALIDDLLGAGASTNVPARIEKKALAVLENGIAVPTRAEFIADVNNELDAAVAVLEPKANVFLVDGAEFLLKKLIDPWAGAAYDKLEAALKESPIAPLLTADAKVGGESTPSSEPPSIVAPVISGFDPTSGGGVPVRITGSGLNGVDRVYFGGAAAKQIVGGTDTELDVVSPDDAVTGAITVINDAGRSTSVDQFTAE